MNKQSYLIDTNILIGLEDHRRVEATYAKFHALASEHKVDIYVHEAARDDIARDNDTERREISLSKIDKYRILKKRRGLTEAELQTDFGSLNKPNDIVDATLLYALKSGAVDVLVTQDKGLHERAQARSLDLAHRVLFIADATELLIQIYEPKAVPIHRIAEVEAHEIDHRDPLFDSLRDRYPDFDGWWQTRCVNLHRDCWVIYVNDQSDLLAGLIVRKDEGSDDTDAVSAADKILKICTFKVAPESRGFKLGELLLKQVLWYAQRNDYDLAYLTIYEDQPSLIGLLEYYGFSNTGIKPNGERIYERPFSQDILNPTEDISPFDQARRNYPRFLFSEETCGFCIPIKEDYHDILYPDLWNPRQPDLFGGALRPSRPGNTIRKVYLCRAKSQLGPPGSLLFFYKSTSKEPPSQAITALGILESMSLAHSTKELMRMTKGRSVYSEQKLDKWKASTERPIKVINYLLVAYVEPPVSLAELKAMGVVKGHPPQSIYELPHDILTALVARANLGFDI